MKKNKIANVDELARYDNLLLVLDNLIPKIGAMIIEMMYGNS